MKCSCDELEELTGNEASDYANKHLTDVRNDPVNWITEYECPQTGVRYVLDYPHAPYHGGGPPRLRSV